ncbi:MAG: class II glutamine amidotransferase [Oscillospiraceae bacterium]|nr:class II glutamine amidotransferase [Oscillospiraceae bacterium]
MCELFGVSAATHIDVTDLLREFFSHSVRHPNGWGLATFYGNSTSLEKEPVTAADSEYLRHRLSHKVEIRAMIAHIRKATVGTMDYENCHPFVLRDSSQRCWTFAHNGTMFDCPMLDGYYHVQEGGTDSERVLYCFVDNINKAITAAGRELTEAERFSLIDKLVCRVTPGNKMNFLLSDSEYIYVHTNYANSLYYLHTQGGTLFATVPLGHHSWEPMPFTTLCVYQDGNLVYTGTCHGNEYIDNISDTRYLFLDYSAL